MHVSKYANSAQRERLSEKSAVAVRHLKGLTATKPWSVPEYDMQLGLTTESYRVNYRLEGAELFAVPPIPVAFH